MIQIDHKEYPRKLKSLSPDSLRYIRQDAHDAMMANPEGEKAGYYADEINYVCMELRSRETPDKAAKLRAAFYGHSS